MKRKQRFNKASRGAMLLMAMLFARAAAAQPVSEGVGIPPEARSPDQLTTEVAPDVPVQRIELPPTLAPSSRVTDQWGPPEVGYVVPLPDELKPTDAWQSLPEGGAVLRLEFTSANAKGLRLQLRGELNGLQLRVYDPSDHSAFGPYTVFPGVWQEGEEPTWWTPTIDGNSIGLEYFQKKANPVALPEVAAVGYLFDDVVEDEFLGGTCILDSTCYAAWANEAAGIGRMLYQEGTSFFLCTGSMVNRNPADPVGQQSPIFMTARHCIHDQPAANSLE